MRLPTLIRIPFRAAVRTTLIALATAGASLFLSGGLAAQDPDSIALTGRVLRDGSPVPGSLVTLHRVTAQSSGEVGSVLSDETGAFRFQLEPVEAGTFTVYFATAEYLSVRYFGRPIHPTEAGEEYVVEVYDTVLTLEEPIRVSRRDMVLLAEPNGSWDVNEVLQITNPARAALVGRPGNAAWEFSIPAGATDFEAGEAEILPHEITRMGDRVMLVTPVTPGTRTLLIRYRLPRGPSAADVPIGAPTDTFNLFVRLPSHLTSVTGIPALQIFDLENEQFVQYGGTTLLPGSRVEFRWGRGSAAPLDPVLTAVVVTLILLAMGIVAAVRNRSQVA